MRCAHSLRPLGRHRFAALVVASAGVACLPPPPLFPPLLVPPLSPPAAFAPALASASASAVAAAAIATATATCRYRQLCLATIYFAAHASPRTTSDQLQSSIGIALTLERHMLANFSSRTHRRCGTARMDSELYFLSTFGKLSSNPTPCHVLAPRAHPTSCHLLPHHHHHSPPSTPPSPPPATLKPTITTARPFYPSAFSPRLQPFCP